MKHQAINLSILFSGLLLWGCNNTPKPIDLPEEEKTIINDSTAFVSLESNGIKLTEVVSPLFDDTKLSMNSPEEGAAIQAGKVNFSYSVEGGDYKLGAQTADAPVKGCANSDKGQHIHLILNNQPYSAHYEAEFTKDLDPGSYVALSFISRSYHESLKHEGAAVLSQFSVGGADVEDFDMNAPHLFYSRPKGSYTGEDVKKVMLDFYLINTTIAKNGNYVSVTIDDATTFKITKWVPYFIDGLALGEHKIKIELKNVEGISIEGPFNVEERTFTLVNE